MGDIERIELGGVAGLSEALEGLSPESLCRRAKLILDHSGVKSTVNGFPGRVTPYAQEVEIDGRILYARLADVEDPGITNESVLVSIVFDEDPNTDVKTIDPFAFTFREVMGDITLFTSNGIEPILDNPEHLAVARGIIDGIGKEHQEDILQKRQAAALRMDRLKSSIGNAWNKFTEFFGEDDIDGTRKAVAGWGAVILSLTYSHAFYTNVDATIGPIPMPQPIELIVDMNNASDHTAQAFGEPDGATSLVVGDAGPIPLVVDFDTGGAPSGLFVNSMDGSGRFESREGLYEFTTTSDRVDGLGSLNNEGCTTVSGDFQEGVSQIFTQDAATAETASYEVLNADELEVCLPEPVAEDRATPGTASPSAPNGQPDGQSQESETNVSEDSANQEVSFFIWSE